MKSFFEKDELKILWPFYLEKLISHTLFFAPAFWTLQLNQNVTLSVIGLLWAVYGLAAFFFEVPTGAIADIYGRKFSTLIGYIISTISLLGIYFSKGLFLLYFFFALWGFGLTFCSGAKESWIIDRLRYYKKEKLTREFYAKQQAIIGISLVLSGFIGAYFVAKLGLNVIWLFASFSFLLSFILLSLVKEHKLSKDKKLSFRAIFTQARKAISYSWKHHILFFLLIAAFFYNVGSLIGSEVVWQPLLSSLGLKTQNFGYLFSLTALIMGLGGLVSGKLLKKFKNEKEYLVFLTGLTLILYLAAFFASNYIFAIVLYCLIYLSTSFLGPVSSTYFQAHTPSKMRATVTSFLSMISSIAISLGLALSGILGDLIGPRYTIVVGGFVFIPMLIAYWMIKEK